jgi:hypothetical protein
VHEGGWNLQLSRAGALTVRSPTGTEMPAVGKSRAAEGDSLVERHRLMGQQIDDETLCHGGERFDLGLTIDALLGIAGKGVA